MYTMFNNHSMIGFGDIIELVNFINSCLIFMKSVTFGYFVSVYFNRIPSMAVLGYKLITNLMISTKPIRL